MTAHQDPTASDLAGAGGRRTSAEILQERLIARDLQLVDEVVGRVAADGSAVRAAAAIVSARRRFVVGAGLSSAYASLLATQLTGGLAHVTLVDTFIRTVDIVSEAKDTDSLVAFSFRPYRRGTVDFARMFRRAGSSVIAVTDDVDSPLVPFAHDVILIAPDGPPSEVSGTAVAAVSNLVAALATASAKGARRRFAERAEISEELGIYLH